MATLGLSKVFILDKYFTELQKFWETEKKLQDASSSNEAVHLQQRLRSLSTELVTLRNRLHVSQPAATVPPPPHTTSNNSSNNNNNSNHHSNNIHGTAPCTVAANQQPIVPPRHTALPALPQHINTVEPFTGKCHQQRLSDKKSAGTIPQQHQQHHQPPLPSLVSAPEDPQQQQQQPVTVAMRPVGCAELEDLIHLAGPLTEDAVLKCLQARFCASQFFTNVGPILLSVNPYSDVGNPLTLTSTRGVVLSPKLLRVVQEAVRQQSETGYPQAIILSGTSGSGKTYASMLLLRQLFDVAGGGPETDAFKHLAAAFTVLRSLGSAKTASNSESSRIGHFIEVQVTDGALYRTKIHCYFLDQTRVIRPLPNEKNYHIFYQMLAGLTQEERAKLSLEGYSPHNLRYLQCGDTRQDEAEDAARFQAWKACLGVLGIPFLDVVRVLAAVLLLGNVQFVDGQGLEVDVKGDAELKAVASLLGVSGVALFRGLTSRTHNARGQLVKSVCDANMSNMTRDSLAKALYCRTVATIVRRANSLKRLGSTLGTLSSDSNESVHNQAEIASQHASTVGTAGSKSSKSMAALNNAVRHATDGFIGILDMFGFEDPKPSQLEHLCINLCAETMQHFYNTHIFKSSIESCRDEGIHCEVEVDYVDNVPCIDLISSLRTGLLSMLDVECSIRGTAESYIAKVKVQHKQNPRLFEPKPLEPRTFGIQHFAGRVVYDASDFLDTNKDVVPDDLVAVFHKHSCNFGFATHLFGSELKALYSAETVPRGVSFRISPTSHTDLLNGDEPVSTLTQDFHTRLDNLLRTLVHARPHFVRCLRSNASETPGRFDRATVMRQIRSLQVLETVNLMAGGYPHRMRFKAFNLRYRLLAPFRKLRRADDKAMDDCHLILQCLQQAMEEQPKLRQCAVSNSWALGKRHIFLSEGARQQLETLRSGTRHRAAVLIQATWRGWRLRRRWPALRRSLELQQQAAVSACATMAGVTNTSVAVVSVQQARAAAAATAASTGTGAATAGASSTRPRPQPIAGTPPPDPAEKCDHKMIQQTCTLFGLDLERPPPVPPSRPYTVTGNTKLGYPQTRVMKMPFPEDASGDVVLLKGETVLVVGASQRRGHLVVEHNNVSLHVPFQFLELKPVGVNI
ncbi:myosin-I heavy chain isoform X2 [Periplaneta americana]|uniref:myosin-I heavy chain isoform X2 n=1 Tax=Periplaneta americana TaxID=6978 RepID=UPI0037E8D3D7